MIYFLVWLANLFLEFILFMRKLPVIGIIFGANDIAGESFSKSTPPAPVAPKPNCREGISPAAVRQVAYLYLPKFRPELDTLGEMLDQTARTVPTKPLLLKRVLCQPVSGDCSIAEIAKRVTETEAVAVLGVLEGLSEISLRNFQEAFSAAGIMFRAISPSDIGIKSVAIDIVVDLMVLPSMAPRNILKEPRETKPDEEVVGVLSESDKMISELEKIIEDLDGPKDDSLEAQISARKAECRALGLDSALNYLYWEIEHYPHWIKSSPSSVCPAIENPRDVGLRHIEFKNKGRIFSIKYEVQESLMPEPEEEYRGSARMTLYTPANNKVLEVDGSGISAYVPGEWSLQFLEIYRAAIEFKRARQLRDKELGRATNLGKLKKDFGL